MKPIRFYIAMIFARFTYYGLRLVGRNATHLPGSVAAKICPEILKYLEVSDKFIAITGTNGKTTTTNMILSFLGEQGVDYVGNKAGSNIAGGIISALLTSTSFFGKNKKEITVFEIDERASLQIFPYIQPDLLVVTNLFRDSYARNAHVDYIVETLETSIPESTTLILNGDDLITSNLANKNERKYFSIRPQDNEEEVKDSIIQDIVYCPKCGESLVFDFQRYHHIGKANCENCDYKSPEADFLIREIKDNEMIIKEDNKLYHYENNTSNIIDQYNKLAAISALRAIGYDHDLIVNYFNGLKVTETRFDETIVDNKRYVSILSKDQNPVANTRVFDFIRNQKNWGTMTIIFINEMYPHAEALKNIENLAWLYDANFEYLNIEAIKEIHLMGHRTLEYKSRLLFAGIEEGKIHLLEPSQNISLKTKTDTTIILHSTKNIEIAKRFKEQIIEEAKDEN